MLDSARITLDEYLPDLAAALRTESIERLESDAGHGIELFKRHGGPKLLIPREYGGLGATALAAVRIQMAVGAYSPSLAAATTMHHFSISSLIATARQLDSAEWLLLDAIADQNLLVASGFAEGVPGTGVLAPAMSARQVPNGYVLNGVKQPCSLSRSMDLITVSLLLDNPVELAIAVVSARSPGVHVTPFWKAPILRGAESDTVRLNNVEIAPRQLVRLGPPGAAGTEAVQQVGFLWFELLITAGYLGAAARLVERVVEAERGTDVDRVRMVSRLRAAQLGIEALAARLDETSTADLLVDALMARFAAQDTIGAVVTSATELLGGLAFIQGDPITRYFGEAARCLAFHPPSLSRAAAPMADWMAGKPLQIA